MPPFLSPAWFADRPAPPLAGASAQLTIQQRVTGAPGGDVMFVVRVIAGQAYVEPGQTDDADVLLTEDYETALAIHEGRLSAADALIAGRIKVGGALNRLLDHGAALEGIV